MFWKNRKKKKRRGDGMIDIGKLHRQGRVRAPRRNEPSIKTNSDGYVDVMNLGDSGGGSSVSKSKSIASFSSESDGYSKKEVDSKIQQLDSMIYKLEQRVEVLERKAGVDSGVSSSGSVGAMGW